MTAQIITFNEEEMLPACLAALTWVDEIVVVDSHSRDRTREIARARGAKVFEHDFTDFASQFNWAMEQATGDWIFVVDADEVVDAQLSQAIRDTLAGEPAYEVYQVVRDAFFLGHRMRATSWSGEALPRLFRRGCLSYRGQVHSVADSGGRPVGRLPGRILHYTYRDMGQYFRKFDLYTTHWARDAFAQGRRV
ncbi:MAG: glycosyltransferase family 2 protein, partial [Planctomycetota bacterium]|nr:glycosyltransferase family 2 protein [Planctomycetota bacterium]